MPGKAELLDLMLDTVYRQMPRGDLSGLPWRERLAAVAHENRDLFARHPWIAEVSTAAARPGANRPIRARTSGVRGPRLNDVEMDAALTFLLGWSRPPRARPPRRPPPGRTAR